jgi:hypothetical protein
VKITALALLLSLSLSPAARPADAPRDVPPVRGTIALEEGPGRLRATVTAPTYAWSVKGEARPKLEWPELSVDVGQTTLSLELTHHPASALAEHARDRVVDLRGQVLPEAELRKRLAAPTPVLVSVSGRMPDAYHLECLKDDTLIVIPGLPNAPAPQLLPGPRAAVP